MWKAKFKKNVTSKEDRQMNKYCSNFSLIATKLHPWYSFSVFVAKAPKLLSYGNGSNLNGFCMMATLVWISYVMSISNHKNLKIFVNNEGINLNDRSDNAQS